MGFSEIFWSSVVTTASGILLACLAACYKSKCSNVSLCFGMINLKREVNIELQEDLKEMDNTLRKLEEQKTEEN
jgi:hypothetical protein